MVETGTHSDMQVGAAAMLTVLALLAAVGMYLAAGFHEQVASGWAFAVAMLAGSLLVVALHVYADG